MAISTNIEFMRGEDVTLEITVTGENIAGWALAFAIARGYGDDAEFTKTTASGINITDGANGVFQVAIADTDTDDLPTGGYVWDARRTDAGLEVVLARGNLNLKPNVAD